MLRAFLLELKKTLSFYCFIYYNKRCLNEKQSTIFHKSNSDVCLLKIILKNMSDSLVKVLVGKLQVESVNDLFFIKNDKKLK